MSIRRGSLIIRNTCLTSCTSLVGVRSAVALDALESFPSTAKGLVKCDQIRCGLCAALCQTGLRAERFPLRVEHVEEVAEPGFVALPGEAGGLVTGRGRELERVCALGRPTIG